MVIDFSESNDEMFDSQWEPVPEGRYDAFVYEVSKDEWNGNPVFDFTFKLDGGEYDGREVQTRYFLSSPEAMGYFKNVVLGNINDDFQAEGQVEEGEIIEATQGKPCRVEVEVDEYENNDGEMQPTNDIDGVYSASEEQLDTADHLP